MFTRPTFIAPAPLFGALLFVFAGTAIADQHGDDSDMFQPSASNALVSDFRYSYGELRYVDIESGIDDAEADGFLLGGSYRVDERAFVFGSYTDLEADVGIFDVDITQIKLGGGYIYPLNDTVDVNATAALVREDYDFSGADDDDETGFQLTGGVRTMITNELEVRGALVFYDVDDRDVYLEIAADYYFTENLVGGISIEFAGDNDVLTFGGRYYYGR